MVTVHSGQYPPDSVPAVTTDPTLTLARQIAACLGDGWHASRSDWMVLIGHPDGRQLHLSRPDRLPGRVVAAGMYPPSDYHFRGTDRHQITVAVNRGATVIAAEIGRRLLPGYEQTLTRVRDWETRQAAEAATRARVAEQVLAVLPGAYLSGLAGRNDTILGWHNPTDPAGHSGQIRFLGDAQTAEIDARSVPTPLAIRLLAVLAEGTAPR